MRPPGALSSDDTATAVAVGVLAATLAVIGHETIGHGLGCMGSGGHVTLLTSIWFRCSQGTPLSDAGGPLANLLAGFAAIVLLVTYAKLQPAGRLFLFMFGALNLCWFTAQLAYESLTGTHDDWYWLLQSRPALWRPVGALGGVGGYLLATRWFSGVIRRLRGPQAHAILLAYAAAAGSAVVSGLLWQPEPLRSALEGFLTLGVAPVGLLRIARSSRAIGREVALGPVPRSWIWICGGFALFGAFLFIQARGLGPMSGSVLPR